MKKRPVVLFFPDSSAANPNPRPIMLRCTTACPDDFIQKCSDQLNHLEFTHPQGRGKVLIGREHEPHIVKQDSKHPSAIAWGGVQRSGKFPTFVRQHISKLFSSSAATATV